MHIYIYEMNILVDFVLNKNDRGRKKAITREKHPGACCTYEKKKRRDIV